MFLRLSVLASIVRNHVYANTFHIPIIPLTLVASHPMSTGDNTNEKAPKRVKLNAISPPNQPTMTDSLTFLSTICGSLKDIKRTGWVRMGVPLPESDADHMHRCAMCAMLITTQGPDPRDDYSGNNEKFLPSKIDGMKLLRMAVTHDLCESIAGDVTPFCDAGAVASKHDKEKAAMEEIRKIVGDPLGKELYELWNEYEELETPEALYCKDIDKFEMVMQCYEYEKAHLNTKNDGNGDNSEKIVSSEPMRTFFVTTSNIMKSPLFKRLDAELRTKREGMLKEKGWDVTEAER
jgi:putative hydrolase of HD superfamily